MRRKQVVWCTVHGDIKACSCRPDEIILEAGRQHYVGQITIREQREKRKAR